MRIASSAIAVTLGVVLLLTVSLALSPAFEGDTAHALAHPTIGRLPSNGSLSPLFAQGGGVRPGWSSASPGSSSPTNPRAEATVFGSPESPPPPSVQYTVTFNETSLPSGVTWGVVINGTLYFALAGSSVEASLPNGTFSYRIDDVPGWHQVTLPYEGSLQVNGSAVSEGPIHFTRFLWPVTFSESGVPANVTWSVVINGTTYSAAAGTSIVADMPNGTFSYAIQDVVGWHQATLPYEGTVIVSGQPVTEPLLLFTPTTYAVSFTEQGLPAGTDWSVTIAGSIHGAVTPGSISAELANGTFAYVLRDVPGWHQSTLPYSGSGSVNGSSIDEPTLAFVQVVYPLTFRERGLPTNTSWTVSVNGVPRSASAPNSIVTSVPNGTFSYTISDVPGWHQSTVAYSGTGAMDAASIVEPTLVFGPTVYPVTFTESGLLEGSWSVTIGAQTFSSNSATLLVQLVNGSYTFTVGALPTYLITPPSGSFRVNGSAFEENITFSPRAPGTYFVSFQEAGLPFGRLWTVAVVADAVNVTRSTSGATLVFALANGTYRYSVSSSGLYYARTGPSGSVTVNGLDQNVTVTYAFTYAITFDPSGLATGTRWTAQAIRDDPATWFVNSTGPSATLQLANGTYTYILSAPGYPTITLTGQVVQGGGGAPISVSFSPSSTVSAFPWLYLLVGAVFGVGAAGVLLFLRRAGKLG